VAIGYYVPGVIPGPILVACSEGGAIAVSHLEVFPDGIEIPMSIYARDPDWFYREPDDLPHDRRFRLKTEPWRLRLLDPHGINLKIDLPDGKQLSTEQPYVPTPAPSKPPHSIATAGIDCLEGFGTGGHHKIRLFLWPLPTEGAIRIAVDWPDQQIPETSITLDPSTVLEAADRAKPLWGEDAGLPSHYGGDYN
jgi:hypothetical protein